MEAVAKGSVINRVVSAVVLNGVTCDGRSLARVDQMTTDTIAEPLYHGAVVQGRTRDLARSRKPGREYVCGGKEHQRSDNGISQSPIMIHSNRILFQSIYL